jgi:hypothetical protein
LKAGFKLPIQSQTIHLEWFVDAVFQLQPEEDEVGVEGSGELEEK